MNSDEPQSSVEILTSDVPVEAGAHRARPERPRRRKRLLAALAALVVVVGGGVAAAVALLPSGGAQPEDLLPANTIAFIKLDLAPGLGQEIDAVRFLSHFPNTFKNLNTQDPIGSLLGDSSRGSGVDWSQIKPWLGNRFAMAVVSTATGLHPVALIAITDEGKMRSYVAAHASATKVAVADGFAILSNDQGAVDSVKSATTHLSGAANYKADRAALGGEQILVAWGDLKPIYRNLQSLLSSVGSSLGSSLGGQLPSNVLAKAASVSGRVILGVHFTSSSVVATILARGAGASPKTFTGASADVAGLPRDVLAAVSLAPFNPAVLDSTFQQPQYAAALQQFGVSASDVGGALAGGVTLVVLPSTADPTVPLFAIRLRPANIDATQSLISSITGGSAANVEMQTSGPYLYVGQSSSELQDAIRRLSASGPKLGALPAYQSVVPGSGVLAGYADLSNLLVMSPGAPADVRKLNSIGMLMKLDPANPGDGAFTLTLTVK